MTKPTPMPRPVKDAVRKYSMETCLEAYRLNSVDGEGANTIAIYLGLPHTNSADSAINAGEWLSKHADKLRATRYVIKVLCGSGPRRLQEVEETSTVPDTYPTMNKALLMKATLESINPEYVFKIEAVV